MRRQADPRPLLASFGLAALLSLLACLLIPRSWVQWWLRPYQGSDGRDRAGEPWQILPEPRTSPAPVLAVADSSARPERVPSETIPVADPAWWRAAWRDWAADGAHDRRAPAPSALGAADLLCSRLISAIPDSLWRRARIDTSHAARLAAVQSFYASDLRGALPDLRGLMATRKATDILNREAELFGEYLLMK